MRFTARIARNDFALLPNYLPGLRIAATDYGRDAAMGAQRGKSRFLLYAGHDVEVMHGVGHADLFEHDRNFPAVRRGCGEEIEHGARLARQGAVMLADDL